MTAEKHCHYADEASGVIAVRSCKRPPICYNETITEKTGGSGDAEEAAEKNIHVLERDGKLGEVKIADEVVAMIAGLAATEVEGVDSMAGNITNELVGKLGMKNLSKGVKVEVGEEHVSVDLSLNMKYGYSLPAVSEKVQERVRTAIETMTGLTVLEVNIKIAGVNMREES